MSTKELKADANALMNLEMMDSILGGASENPCQKSCTQDCKPSCKTGCSHSGKNDRKNKPTKKTKP